MTREEIFALEGLELRKAVATAYGYRVYPSEGGYLPCAAPNRMIWGEYFARQNPDDCWRDYVPHFESDIEVAWWLAIDLLRCGYSLVITGIDPATRRVTVEFAPSPLSGMGSGSPATLICRAYLLAKAVRK